VSALVVGYVTVGKRDDGIKDGCDLTTITLTGRTIRAATAVYVLLLVAVSLLPSGTESLGGWDTALSPSLQNTLHVPAYSLLLVLSAACLPEPLRTRRIGILAVAAAGIGFGGLLELVQALVPGRMGSVADALLNTLGVLLGVAATCLWQRRQSARRARLAQIATSLPKPVKAKVIRDDRRPYNPVFRKRLRRPADQ